MNLRALAFLLLLTPSANLFAQQRRALQPTAAALVAAGPVPAPAIQSTAAANELHIPVGRSVVLTSAAPLRRVYVGNPAVLQTYTSGTTEVVLTAKAPGVSSMVLWDESLSLIHI